MGCSASKIEEDDKVRACKERIGLVKQLMVFREDFVNAQFAYLRSLKNVGATLRQLTDSHTSVLENTDFDSELPPSPPPPLTPFINKSQESTSKDFDFLHLKLDTDDEDDYEDMPILPPPRIEDWDRWHSTCRVKIETGQNVSENEKNNGVGETSIDPKELYVPGEISFTERLQEYDMTDKESSLMSWYAKQKTKSAMGVWGERKTLTLAGITKDLDECFLKASAVGTGLAVFMDTKSLGVLHLDDNKSIVMCHPELEYKICY